MIIRRAELADLREIAEIEKLCFPEDTAFPIGMFAYLLRYAIALVACEGQVMVGFVIGYPSGRMGSVYTLDVHPEYRRRGIGYNLIEALERELINAGSRRTKLEVAVENPVARALYQKAGYKEAELLKSYYGRGKNAIRMTKHLNA
jgi:[ribosomal protein S18]-alanine N-acetyltransferase